MEVLEISEIGEVAVQRRRGIKNITLRFDSNGRLKVTAPKRLPKRLIESFVLSKKQWLADNQPTKRVYRHGDSIAHQYQLETVHDSIPKPKKLLAHNSLRIAVPTDMDFDSDQAQQFIQKQIIWLLRKEAKRYLPERLACLAQQHGFSYNGLSVRNVTSRWGSCTHAGKINLNIRLMNLPHDVIDHVLLHELTHTQHLNHSPQFWSRLEEADPNFKAHRSRLKSFDALLLVMA